MSQKITITVSGYTNSGKSTIAREIVERLRSGGFNIENDDIDAILCPVDNATQAKRLCSVLDNEVDIHVETKYKPREKVNQYMLTSEGKMYRV